MCLVTCCTIRLVLCAYIAHTHVHTHTHKQLYSACTGMCYTQWLLPIRGVGGVRKFDKTLLFFLVSFFACWFTHLYACVYSVSIDLYYHYLEHYTGVHTHTTCTCILFNLAAQRRHRFYSPFIYLIEAGLLCSHMSVCVLPAL